MSPYGIWDGYMRSYDFLTEVDGYKQNIKDIAQAAQVQQGMSVLDAGSGTGNLSLLLKSHGARIVSCDFCPSALGKHREKDPAATLVQASLEEPLPFENEQFDAVCCASVLFALSEQGCKQAVREFNRVLKPGGRLVVTVPAGEAKLMKLVRMHFTTKITRYGMLAGISRAIGSSAALGRVLYYNKKLKNLPDWHGFHAFTELELQSVVSQAGFEKIASGRTYGGVFFIVTAQKPISVARETLQLTYIEPQVQTA